MTQTALSVKSDMRAQSGLHYILPTPGATSSSVCAPCPTGSYSNAKGLHVCEPCRLLLLGFGSDTAPNCDTTDLCIYNHYVKEKEIAYGTDGIVCQ